MELLKKRFVLRLQRWKSRELWHSLCVPSVPCAEVKGSRSCTRVVQGCARAVPKLHCRTWLSSHPGVPSLGKEPNWAPGLLHPFPAGRCPLDKDSVGHPELCRNTLLKTPVCDRRVHTSAQLLKSRIKWCTTEQAHESLQNLNIYF